MTTNCNECGSDEIIRNIPMSQAVEAGYAGLQYKAALILSGTKPLLSDLCSKCGTVIRLHVKNADRKWETKN